VGDPFPSRLRSLLRASLEYRTQRFWIRVQEPPERAVRRKKKPTVTHSKGKEKRSRGGGKGKRRARENKRKLSKYQNHPASVIYSRRIWGKSKRRGEIERKDADRNREGQRPRDGGSKE